VSNSSSIDGIAAVEEIRRIAYETVLRACGFGSLTIFCIMIGLSFSPTVSFQSGGFLTTVMALILALKAYEARRKPYRRTEMWLYLPKEARPPAAAAQQITSTVMREVYLTFAVWTAGIAIGLWAMALASSFIGV
jgi:hypothetical protein